MATVVLDTVRDAEVSIENTRVGFVRTGYIKDFDVSGTADQIMARAIDTSGLPVKYSPHPYFPYAILQRYQFTTQRAVNWKIWFKLYYDTPEFRNPAGDSLFTLERSRFLVETRTSKHPKDWSDLNLGWVNEHNDKDIRPVHSAEFRYMQPHLRLTATGYILGDPPDEYETAYGSVNQTTWQGFPKAYWRYDGADDRTQDFGNSYSVRLNFLTQVTQDWRQSEAFRDHTTGDFLPVNPADANDLLHRPYIYGAVNHNGIIMVGLYPLTEFNDIFGF